MSRDYKKNVYLIIKKAKFEIKEKSSQTFHEEIHILQKVIYVIVYMHNGKNTVSRGFDWFFICEYLLLQN